MVVDPDTVLGLADGGAHVALICDASVYTSMLSYWSCTIAPAVPALPLELAVAKMTGAPAAALRASTTAGVIAPGKKADLNVVDLERLQLRLARGGRRPAHRRAARRSSAPTATSRTIVAGEVIAREGDETGARPGRLVRRGSFR